MRIGVCAGPEAAMGWPAGLVDFLEVTVGGFLKPLENEDAFEASLRAQEACTTPVEVANCFFPGGMKTTGPVVDAAALDEFAETAFARARKAGIDLIVFGSGGSRAAPEGFPREEAFEQLAGHLKRWAPLAAAHEVLLTVEPLNRAECNIINTLDEGKALVDAVGHPAVALLLDLYHSGRDGEPLEAVYRAQGLIRHAHVAEVPERTRPGARGDDFRQVFQALKAIGYDGRLAMECRWENMDEELSDSVSFLRRQLADAGY